MITDISMLDPNKKYTYAQYLTWMFSERVELIKGKLFKMSPAPSRRHQKVSGKMTYIIQTHLLNKRCEIYAAPFDVRFPVGEGDDKTYTVVQPDICVVCDKSKLDDRGCVGAPDLIVEIISPGSSKKDVKDKFALYEENGVKEYWIVSPETKLVDVFLLDNKGKYQFIKKYTEEDILPANVLKGLNVSLSEVFVDD